ncbi:hypothetical protein [Streptomyces sp. NPDC058548]|uniref:hypothetical protein n=1 Tax=Streptomyces sp. NPDC058548 TaxID=3346545 RepID=UPI00365D2806
MAFPADPPNLGGNAVAARSRRDLLVAGHVRMLTETIGHPLQRAQQTAQIYRAAARYAELDRRGAPTRRWLCAQSGLCHRRARIAADEAALATEQKQATQASAWAALADRYAKAARHLACPALRRCTAITILLAAAEALDARPLPLLGPPAERPEETTPLSGIAQFNVESGRQALASAQRAEGPVLKYVNTVEVELLLFSCYAHGQNETGYHIAMQAIRALNRARKTAPEGHAEDMDRQALATAYELVEQALGAAEAAAAPAP